MCIQLVDDLLDVQLIREERVGEAEYLELTQSRMRDVILEGIPVNEFATRHQRIGEAARAHVSSPDQRGRRGTCLSF